MSVDMSPEAVHARLLRASQLAGSLRPERRLETKIDMSPAGVHRRIKEASELLALARRLRKAGRAAEGKTESDR